MPADSSRHTQTSVHMRGLHPLAGTSPGRLFTLVLHTHTFTQTHPCAHTGHTCLYPQSLAGHSPQTHTAAFHRANTGRAGPGTAHPETPLLPPAPCSPLTASTCFGKGALKSHKQISGEHSPVMPTHSRSILQRLQLLGPISEFPSS